MSITSAKSLVERRRALYSVDSEEAQFAEDHLRELQVVSGNGIVMPYKVWRNRLRCNNETLKPSVPVDLDALDEPTIRLRVIAALGLPARVSRG